MRPITQEKLDDLTKFMEKEAICNYGCVDFR